MSELNPPRHVSYEQVKCMLDFMGRHAEFAAGGLRSLEARRLSKRLWGELACSLNACRGGTRKSVDGWSKYWSDFKNKLKNKVRILHKRKRLGAKSGARPLSKLERRALAILGPCFQRTQQDLPEVKLEKELEKSSGSSETPDRHSEDEADSNFDNSDNDPDEPPTNTLYPKWLIEVEQKRAEAEAGRARAAAAQADALAGLARAAAAQADALARIATALDRTASRIYDN